MHHAKNFEMSHDEGDQWKDFKWEKSLITFCFRKNNFNSCRKKWVKQKAEKPLRALLKQFRERPDMATGTGRKEIIQDTLRRSCQMQQRGTLGEGWKSPSGFGS